MNTGSTDPVPFSPPFDLAETDRLLCTTRAVRKRLDFDRPVEPGDAEEDDFFSESDVPGRPQ